MISAMERNDIEALAATIGSLLAAVEAHTLDASPVDRERLGCRVGFGAGMAARRHRKGSGRGRAKAGSTLPSKPRNDTAG
jgi:hypothetical protein